MIRQIYIGLNCPRCEKYDIVSSHHTICPHPNHVWEEADVEKDYYLVLLIPEFRAGLYYAFK